MSAVDDMRLMGLAIDEAARAPSHGDVPVGCVISRDGEVIAAARNERELRADPTAHAEVLAIRAAALALGGWRLIGCQMHVTLEPCPMCAGAILSARLERVVFGASDPKLGAAGSRVDLLRDPRLPGTPFVESGPCAERSASLLQGFFTARR
jgi:tRNA(adenine34) deaminase